MAEPVERVFPGTTTSPAAARQFATTALDPLIDGPYAPDLRDDLELVISELVTNAVRAGSPTVRVWLGVERRRLVVRVMDTAPGWPQARIADVHDTGGRGLSLISAVSSAWGVRIAETEKVVWAELAIATPDLATTD